MGETFAKRHLAEQRATEIEHSMLTGAYVDPSAGRVNFSDYAEEWQAVQVIAPRLPLRWRRTYADMSCLGSVIAQ
jgi:hypothetical protein